MIASVSSFTSNNTLGVGASMETGEAAAVEPLKYQRWELKVLIHCDGCKKKVKKVLHGIDGVYVTFVDSQQNKVTVIGDVQAETLLKKLAKAGKHAELWPDKPQQQQPKKDKEDSKNISNASNTGTTNSTPNKKKGNKHNGGQPKEKESKPSPGNNGTEAAEEPNAKDTGDQPKVEKACGPAPPTVQKDQSPINGAAEAKNKACNDNGGAGSKKKGKKEQKESNTVGGTGAAPISVGNGVPPPPQPSPFQQQQQHLCHGEFPVYLPTPMYTVSYNVVQPSSTYGYCSPPIAEQMPPQPYLSTYHQPCVDVDEVFCEEKADSCRVM